MNDIVSCVRWRFSRNKFGKTRGTENFGDPPPKKMSRLNTAKLLWRPGLD